MLVKILPDRPFRLNFAKVWPTSFVYLPTPNTNVFDIIRRTRTISGNIFSRPFYLSQPYFLTPAKFQQKITLGIGGIIRNSNQIRRLKKSLIGKHL
jgi:hypothetical protein